MKRHRFPILAAVSLLLLVVTLVLAWCDARIGRRYAPPPRPHVIGFGFERGALTFVIIESLPTEPADMLRGYYLLGVGYFVTQEETLPNPQKVLIRHRYWVIHSLVLALVFAASPFRWIMVLPMWREKPRAWTLLVLILLLLPALATAFFWRRSYRPDTARSSLTLYAIPPHRYDISYSLGTLDFSHEICPDPHATMLTSGNAGNWEFAGFQARGFTYPYPPSRADGSRGPAVPCTRQDLSIPFWAVMVVAASLPLLLLPRLLRARRQSRRLRLGLCASCGYDLRASKDRCPECGAAFLHFNDSMTR